jgi:ABC-2 type transport system ATP-binding protein
MSMIRVKNLCKQYRVGQKSRGGFWERVRPVYKSVTALDNLSFSIEPGEIVGYIGPNGAGKSTTVKILSGILVPDSGTCTVGDRVPWLERQAHVANIGVVFGQRSQLWWDLPVSDSLELLRDMYRVPHAEFLKTRTTLTEKLDIGELLHTPVRQLSLGLRMRCELAAALIHKPQILFLDEPTIGLDAVSKLAVRDFLRQLNQEDGVTIILTTHDMDDIEALCRRVMLIHQGKLLIDGSLEALREQVSRERWLTVELGALGASGELGELGALGELENSAEVIIVHPLATEKQREGNKITLAFDPKQISAARLISELSERYEIADIFVQNPPIEAIIAQIYQKESNNEC